MLRRWCRRRGWRGCKRTTENFDAVKMRAKSVKIRAKSLKTFTESLKIWAKIAPQKKWRYFLLEVGVFSRASLGEFGQKSFATPKICLLLAAPPQIYGFFYTVLRIFGVAFVRVLFLIFFYGGLLLALYNYNGLVAPRLSLYNFWFVFLFWLCSLQLFRTPCAW